MVHNKEEFKLHCFQLTSIPAPYLCNVCLLPALDSTNVCKLKKLASESDKTVLDNFISLCLAHVFLQRIDSNIDDNRFKTKNTIIWLQNLVLSELLPVTDLSKYIKTNTTIMKEATFPPQLSAVHITERIIALVFPLEEQETTYKSSVTGVSQMLHKKYADNYLLINLSERRNDMHQMHKQVIDYGWPENLAPPLERLCTVCKSIDSFLGAAPMNVVVLHCKGGLGRLAVVLSAYIDFSNIYSSDEQSLDAYGMKNFYENKLATYVHPSQRRYIHYFAGLLSGGISINNNSLFLHQIIIRGLPSNNTMQPYIKIYQGMNPIYVSGVFTTSGHTKQIIVTLDPCLQLRSDVIVKCFNNLCNNNNNNFNSNKQGGNSSDKDLIFRCQFHTCAINNNQLKLGKGDLDVACADPAFPPHAQVEFVLSDSTYNWNRYECPPQEHNILIGTSPETMERCNSYEDFQGTHEDLVFDDFNVKNLAMNDESYSKSYSSVQQQQQQNTYMNQQQLHQQQQQQQFYQQQQQQNFQSNHIESFDADGNPVRTNYNASRPQHALSKDQSYKQTNQIASHQQQQDYAKQQQHMLQHQQPLQQRSKSASILSQSNVLSTQNVIEQQQLDEILKELIEEKSSQGALMRGNGPPPHGSITTTSNNMSATLSWNSSQAGGHKSAVVSKQTWARPAPQTNLTTQVTRSREVLEEGDRGVTGGRMTSNENYNYCMPQFEESRKVNMMAEDRVFDVNSLAYRDYVNEQRQQEVSSEARRGFQEDAHKAVAGTDVSWLESQREKLRQRRKHSRAQSDSEEYEAGSFQRRANDPATYHSTNLLPSHHTTVAEYRDAKGRRCRTIETETFSRRCETTTSQAALMPPARSSTPSTPMIPERNDCSREAYIRNQYALKPFMESRSMSRLERPVEVEIVELQPIGPGVQTLESPSANSILRHDKSRTLPREMTTSISVPAFFTANPTRQQTQSFSKTDSYQSNMLVPANPSLQQALSYNGTMPGSFIYQPTGQTLSTPLVQTVNQQMVQAVNQPVVQTIKEVWTQTVNPGSKTAAATVQQQTTQIQPQQQQSIVHREVNSASSDARTVPVFIQQHEGAVTAPANQFNTFRSTDFNTMSNNFNHGNTLSNNSNVTTLNNNFNTMNSNVVVDRQLQQQQLLQQQQQLQQQHTARQQYMQQQQQQNTLRSSSHSRLYAETPRNFSSASSGGYNEQFKSANVGNSFTMSSARKLAQPGAGSTMVAGTGAGRSRTGSFSSVAGDGYDYVNQFPRFVRDLSHLWHRPNFSREDAIQYLKDRPPGSFLIRNSATYQGSYGLTLRVAEVPDNVAVLSDNPEVNLVRHFVIEQTSKGVQLKGSPEEPAFASLGAFVYQHSITPISLPCKLVLPEAGDETDAGSNSVAKDVYFIASLDTESLTGPEALAKALQKTFKEAGKLPTTTEVNFKASSQGITVTDNSRKDFFRKHYPLNSITYLGLDNQDQKWPVADHDGKPISSGRVFGFVARKQAGQTGNHCHLFAEVSSANNPAQKLINFITSIMIDQGRTVTTTST